MQRGRMWRCGSAATEAERGRPLRSPPKGSARVRPCGAVFDSADVGSSRAIVSHVCALRREAGARVSRRPVFFAGVLHARRSSGLRRGLDVRLDRS